MRRPSAKGKGADIFFDDTAEEAVEQGRAGRAEAPTKTGQREDVAEPKAKASFYFTDTLLDRLDRVWMQLRLVDRRITKSELVQAALEEVLEDYEERGEESSLYRRLVG